MHINLYIGLTLQVVYTCMYKLTHTQNHHGLVHILMCSDAGLIQTTHLIHKVILSLLPTLLNTLPLPLLPSLP